jgi:hypothetical protein
MKFKRESLEYLSVKFTSGTATTIKLPQPATL